MFRVQIPFLIAVFMTVTTVCVDDVVAQSGRSRRPQATGMIWLFDPGHQTMYRRIQEELNTNTSQMKLITSLAHDLIEQTDSTNEAARGDGPETPPKVSAAEAKQLQRQIDQAGQSVLANILSKRQFSRATELMRQKQGYRAFEDASFVKLMKLTTTQEEQIASILKTSSRLTDDDEDDISNILKKEQHAIWLKAKGAPFKFPFRPRGRGRNGGPGGSNGSLPEDR